MNGEVREKRDAVTTAVALIEQKVRKTICNTYSSDGRQSVEGRIEQADFETLLSLAQIGADKRASLESIRDELFSLCEDTEEKCRTKFDGPQGLQESFLNGRRYEAKGIRRTMGELFYAALKSPPAEGGK